MNRGTFWNIIVGIYVIALIILVGIIIMASMNKAIIDYSTTVCNQSNGTLIMYPVDTNLNFYAPPNKTGYWCRLSNGTEVDVNIKEIINNIGKVASLDDV